MAGPFECDRCGERNAYVGIWDDDVLSGRIDAICDDCYEAGERIRRPIKPPLDEDGELYYHVKFVRCPHCEMVHEVSIADTITTCPVRISEHENYTKEEIIFNARNVEEVEVTYGG